MRLLLTGFEPFAGDTSNPSADALGPLTVSCPRGFTVATALLPVAFDHLDTALEAAIAQSNPDIVLSLGLAGGRAEISVERIAINLDDARIPDNDGAQPLDRPIAAGGPAAYFATVPVKAMTAAIRAAGAPAALSHSAGTFACNHVFYRAAHIAATRRPGMRVGFIHLPYLPPQAARHQGAPSMALETMVQGLRAAIAALPTATDLRLAEGAIA